MVDVAVSKLVAVTVLVATPTRVLRVENACTDCDVAASNTAIDSSFMTKGVPDNDDP